MKTREIIAGGSFPNPDCSVFTQPKEGKQNFSIVQIFSLQAPARAAPDTPLRPRAVSQTQLQHPHWRKMLRNRRESERHFCRQLQNLHKCLVHQTEGVCVYFVTAVQLELQITLTHSVCSLFLFLYLLSFISKALFLFSSTRSGPILLSRVSSPLVRSMGRSPPGHRRPRGTRAAEPSAHPVPVQTGPDGCAEAIMTSSALQTDGADSARARQASAGPVAPQPAALRARHASHQLKT